MKNVNVIIGLAILIGLIVFLESMSIKHKTTEVSVLWDVTDATIGKPGSDEIIRLYHLDGDNLWNGAEFRLATLSNVNFNPTEVLSLPPRNKWLSNELEREKEIRTFTSKIAFLIDTPQTGSIGKPNSSLYWPLFAELNRLGERSDEIGELCCERRIMVIQSDLMENNLDLSLYDPDQLRSFTSNPTSAKFLADNLSQMASLSGIEVYLLYQPVDARDSQRYTLISEVLKNLLQEKGAKVFRSANLNR